MFVTIVHVWVLENHINDFIQATRENHLDSVKEAGNLRFDILQDESDPAKFVLYEAYFSEKEVAAHKETEHYQRWRDRVAPWMSKPRQGIKHKMLFPQIA
jgi:(4S)-4-hydroxy-5-phosphonooxypentane-2,3-dione isomerase